MKREAKISQQQLGTVRADFKQDDFDRLVHQKGLKLTHEIAAFCSCVREVNGNAEPHCISCGGSGYVFLDPCTLTGVIQAIGYDPKHNQYSEINLGTAKLTTRYTERLGWFDRLTLKDGESVFMENTFPIVRNVNGTDQLSSLLIYEPLKISKVFMYIDAQTPQQELEQFEADGVTPKDFTIEGRKLILSDAILAAHQAAGEEKKYISIRYSHRPQYLVMDIQHDIRNTKNLDKGGAEVLKNMPIHCIIKKAHYLLGDTGFGATAKPA